MQKSIKRWLSCGLALVLILTLLIPAQSVQAASKPKFNVTKKTMLVGKSTTLKISNKIKNAKYVWKTSKKSVATVSSKGIVKAVGKGSAVISCSIKVNNKTKYTLKCKITVTEPVTKDFFERNNIEKSGGERDYMLRPVGSDVFEPMMVEVYCAVFDPEEEEKTKQDYVRLIYFVEWHEQSKWHPDKAIDYNLAVFDNITGRCLRSAQATTETSIGATTEDFSFTGEDGKKYDCSVKFSQDVSETDGKIMMEVIYPSKYFGRIAFQFGSFSDEQKAIYNKIDFEKGYVLDDVPELLKNQYFFISGF